MTIRKLVVNGASAFGVRPSDPARGAGARSGRAGLALTLACAVIAAGHAAGHAGAQATPPPQQEPAQQLPAQSQEQPTPTFKAGVDLVTVDVSVVDADGRPVRGLDVDDFELEVDGEPRRVVSSQFIQQDAAAGPPPSTQYSTNEGSQGGRLVMIVVDQGNIRQGAGGSFVRAAERLLDDLGPGDRVAVAVIPGGRMMEFTRHFSKVRQTLRQTLGAVNPPVTRYSVATVGVADAMAFRRGDATVIREVQERECASMFGASEAACREQVREDMTQVAQDVERRTATTLTVLRDVLGGLRSIEGPKTVVLLTEGLYIDREYGQLNVIGREAAAARAAMYAVVLDNPQTDHDVTATRVSPTSGTDRELRLAGITAVVGYTRGATFLTSASESVAYERLSRELTGYYLIAFEPLPEERDGKAHDIKVRIKRRGVEVRARREFSMVADRAAEATVDELLAESLRAPLIVTELPLRVATYSFPDPQEGQVRLLITAGLGRVTDDAPVKALAYRLTDRDGKLVAGRRYDVDSPSDNDHRWNGTITVAPGTYSLKVATIDTDGRRGTVEHEVNAAVTAAGELAVGDLMLSESGHDGSLQPEIEPTFGAASLDGYLEVSSRSPGRLKQAEVTVEIAEDANAPSLIKSEASMSASKDQVRLIGLATLPLDALPPGEYVARAIVRAGGQPVARVTRPFTYMPTSAALATTAARSLSVFSVRFDRSQVLSAPVTDHFLANVVPGDQAVAARVAAASGGDYARLAEGAGDAAPPGASALLRGVARYANGELDWAANEFRRALAENPDLTAAAFYLGACYASAGKHKEAGGAWQTAIAADDQPAFVYALAAEAFLRAHDWRSATDLADEAIGLWPEDRGVERLRVRALALAGTRDLALAAADQYLGKAPEDDEIVLLAMKLLYDARADGKPVESPAADRRRYERYLARYRAAKGADLALAERWLQAFAVPDSRE